MEQSEFKSLIKSSIKTILNEGLLGLNREQLDNIIRIRYIQGITDKEVEKVMRGNKKLLFSLIHKLYPWMLEYQYPTRRAGARAGWIAPFAEFFYKDYADEDFA